MDNSSKNGWVNLPDGWKSVDEMAQQAEQKYIDFLVRMGFGGPESNTYKTVKELLDDCIEAEKTVFKPSDFRFVLRTERD